jgi:lipopolysaccharide biosynthesis glycosyltransferase
MEAAKETPGASAMEPIRVLFCCNPTYYQHLAVTLVSLLENNRINRVEVHLILSARDPHLETRLWRSLEPYRNFTLEIHDFPLSDYSHFFVDNHVTVDTYCRIFAAEVLSPDIDKILYLDCDLVVLDDLRDLWSTDIGSHALAAVPEPYGTFRREFLGIPADRPYVNAGVMLVNLRRWRAEGLAQRLGRFIEAHGNSLWYWDQDAINAILHDAILPLPYRWNVQAQVYKWKWRRYRGSESGIRDACRRPAVIHYSTAEKPWRFRAIVKRKLLYFDYLAKTDWRGANPLGLAWYHMPEFCLDHLLARAGIDYTLLVRVLRRLRRVAARGFPDARRPWAVLRAKPKNAAPPARQMAADR